MSLTMYGRQLLLTSVWAPDLATLPTSLAIALTMSVPVANASLSQIVEPTATEYARASYGIGGGWWSPDGYGGLFNILEIDFPTVISNWGLILGYAIIDPVQSALIDTGALMEPFVATTGYQPQLPPNTISLGLSEAS